MSTAKITRAVQNLFQQISHMARTLTKGLMRWLLRGLLIIGRKPIASTAGFVLPTTVLLLLVVTLTVGAISFRTYTRSQQAIGERQQRVIYNAATPTIDRAKAKLEFLFNGNRDRRAGGFVTENQLIGMMTNDGVTNNVPRYPAAGMGPDPYTFPGEERIDINDDGKKDNAWVYETEQDASGKSNRITYSIIFDAPNINQQADFNLRDSTKTMLEKRAQNLLIRNAPLSNNTQTNPACIRTTGEEAGTSLVREDDDGWFPDQVDTTMLRKNFQVDAYVLPLINGEPDLSNTVATLEFQQDREVTQGFRWAAWFRNDIEVFPGPPFNWNGAMHTEGNYFITGNFKSYMVSDPDSCLYKESASTMTTPTVKATPSRGQPAFRGNFIQGELRDNKSLSQYTVSNRIDLWEGEKTPPSKQDLKNTTDSVKDTFSGTPEDFALDPVLLHTQDVSTSRGVADTYAQQVANWKDTDLGKRLLNKTTKKPYLDDTFRADNRYGPKPTAGYNDTPISGNIGTAIAGNPELTENTEDKEGLDGYWERRARNKGLRIVVGQRLELGDPAGWGGPTGAEAEDRLDVEQLLNEPLRPWSDSSEKGCSGDRCNEARQRRTLWDNLAAVQATAVYHKEKDKDYPAACIATTVHPGTAGTLDKSATFENLAFGFGKAFAAPSSGGNDYGSNDDNENRKVISDFFRGRGTNGWEYSVPDASALTSSSSPLVKALRNLSYFAGDPLGGAPSFTPNQDSFPHPFPSMAMWGDFSMLRRVLGTNYTATTYNGLSMADKTTLHTAACMLGMLAYNLDYLNKLDYTAVPTAVIGQENATPPAVPLSTSPYWQGLRGHIRAIDAMIYDPLTNLVPIDYRTGLLKGPAEIQKLNKTMMDAMVWIKGLSGSEGSNDPETYVRLLEFWRDSINPPSILPAQEAFKEQLTKEIALARMIIAKEQVARDRRFGFIGSYANGNGLKFSEKCETWYKARTTNYTTNYLDSFKEAAKAEPLMRLCSDRPHYPTLYSLFPLHNHGDVGDTSTEAGTGGQRVQFLVRDKQDNGNAVPTYGNTLRNFSYLSGSSDAGSINDVGIVEYKALDDGDIAKIATQPKSLGGLGFVGGSTSSGPVVPTPGGTSASSSNWTVPHSDKGDIADGITPNKFVNSSSQETYDLVKVCPAGTSSSITWKDVACSRVENLTTETVSLLGGKVNYSGLKPVSAPRYRVAFKDTALMNGRELMSVRNLNLDLELMRTSPVGSDYWLPKSGLIYAFREDAVSESHIVRPTNGTWLSCNTASKLLSTAACQMDTGKVSALASTDPPLNDRKISPKPVDFYPDPDRRPYGFRLRNGAKLWRGTSSGSEIQDKTETETNPKGRGLSFITHNPVYIQGPFNLHRAPNQTSLERADGLEEFKEKLNTANFDSPTSGGFYQRTNLEENFADVKKDQWRPAEVLGDAVTLLSNNFCDGSIEDGIITAGGGDNSELDDFVDDRYGCRNSNNRTSYLNQNRATKSMAAFNKVRWMRSSIVDAYWRSNLPTPFLLSSLSPPPTGRSESPIYIFRNGDPMAINDSGKMVEYNGTVTGYAAMNAGRNLMPAPDGTQMNMILISGLVPSRGGQSYGGLHNFPRFLEDYASRALFFSGAFLQLNFSTYATAPFDQEQWQPGLPVPRNGPSPDEWLSYYGAPARRWGFDVGLKYAPPGPVAERFRSPEPTRSEFYDEPSASDPYIELLKPCAEDPSGCGA